MKKMIAFDLYHRKDSGALERAVPPSYEGIEVYLGSDVHALLKRINAINDNPATFNSEIDELTRTSG